MKTSARVLLSFIVQNDIRNPAHLISGAARALVWTVSWTFMTFLCPATFGSTLVAHYRMDENPATNGTVVVAATGANGVLVTDNGSADKASLGVKGGALQFDGTVDSVTLGTAQLSAGATTVAMWVYPSVSQYMALGELKIDGIGMLLYDLSGQFHVGFRGASAQFLTTENLLSLSSWHHVACVYNGGDKSSASSFTLYVDGVAKALTVWGSVGSGYTQNYIGREGNGANFAGRIDDVGVWQGALTAQQIGNAMNYGVASFEGPVIQASGGEISEDGQYVYHTFRSNGTFEVVAGGVVEYLVVGGGGCGGHSCCHGGGGGGGGVRTSASYPIGPGQYTVVVGAGGDSYANGANSSFGSIVAIGGGHGSYYNTSPGSGGSGGGGSYYVTGGGAGTAGQGYAGGGATRGGPNYGAGGGGGAGQAGGSGTGSTGGKGGNGIEWPTGSGHYYGGGGGGSTYSGGTPGTGGLGGGGNGLSSGGTAIPGLANTGGGGGGCDRSQNGIPYGGSGIVVVRYLKGSTVAISGRVVDQVSGQGVAGASLLFSNAPPNNTGGLDEQTVLLLHADGYDGENDFADTSGNDRPLENSGAALSSAAYKFGESSYNFAGTWFRCPDSDDFAYGSGDFTLECWVKLGSTARVMLLGQAVPGWSSYAYLEYGETGTRFSYQDPAFGIIRSANMTDTASWHHIAVVRNGTTMAIYIDGVAGGDSPVTFAGNLSNVASTFGVGVIGDTTYLPYTGYMDGIRVSKGIARYTANFTPPTAPPEADVYTKLLLNGERHRDATGLHPLTFAGNAQLDTAQSKFGTSSFLFDGSGDYVSLPHSSDWAFGADDFTIDFWLRMPNVSSPQQLFVIGHSTTICPIAFYIASGTVHLLSTSNGSSYDISMNGSISISANTWTHIAIVRNGTSYRTYVNGQLDASLTTSASLFDGDGSVYIGCNYSLQYFMTGSIDEFRISKGIARWTSNFTPPALEYGRAVFETTTGSSGYYTQEVDVGWSGTVTPSHPRGGVFTPPARTYANITRFWVKEDYQWKSPEPIISGRIVNKATRAGVDGVTVTASGGGGSCLSSNGGYYGIIAPEGWSGTVTPSYSTGSFEPASCTYPVLTVDQLDRDFEWVMPDVTISGRVTNEYTGAGMDGAVVQFGDSQPASLVSTSTIAMLHFNGKNGEQTIRDASGPAHPIAMSGTPKLTSSPKKLGNAALSLNGSSYLTATYDYDLDLGPGDFTIDLWARFNANQTRNPLLGLGDGSYSGRTTGWLLTVDSNQLTLYRYDGNAAVTKSVAWTPSVNTWYHLAAVRSGNALKFFVNGVQVGSDQDVTGIDYSRVGTENLYVGGNYWDSSGSLYNFNGYLDEVRLSKGVARWTSAFTPESSADPNDGATKLLLRADGELDASSSARVANAYGNAALTTAQKKYGTASLYLDGSGDYVEMENSTDFDFGTNDFTIDWWEYRTTGANQPSSFTRDNRVDTAMILGYGYSGSLIIYMRGQSGWDIASARSLGAMSLNTWVHLAVVRRGNTFYAFKNGTLTDTWTSSLALAIGDSGPRIGLFSGAYFAGYIDDFRITKGRALWTANFTPPGAELVPAVDGAGTEVTSGGGYYSHSVSYWWSGTSTASYASGTMTPATKTYAAQGGDQTAQNFSWRPPDPVIDGFVRDNATSDGILGVTVEFSNGGGSVVTDGRGYYSNVVAFGWSGEVTPSYSLGSIVPGSKTYSNVTQNRLNENYAWLAPGLYVMGIEPDTGATVGGLPITITGLGFYGTGMSRPVTISYSGPTLMDYPVPVRMDTASLIAAGKLAANGSDLRFKGEDGSTELAYWLESGINTTDTLVWVKVPTIPDGGTTVYVSYSGGGLASQSSLAALFPVLADAGRNRVWLKGNAGTGQTLDGGLVSTWQDQSGNGNHATQTSPGAPLLVEHAVNGLPAVSFANNNVWMNFNRQTALWDTFFVINIDAVQPGGWPPILGDTGGTYHYHGVSGGQGSGLLNGTYAAGSLLGGQAYVNGTYVVPVNVTKQPVWELISLEPTAALTADSLTRQNTFSDRNLAADWAEVILFTSPLSTAERQQVEQYANNKYSLWNTGNLPSASVGEEQNRGVTVMLGGDAATDVQVVNQTTITAVTPAHGAGVVDVVVSNSAGQADTIVGGFTYVYYPNPVVSGRVIHQYTGAGVDGVTLHFSGGAGDVVSSGGGYYSKELTYGRNWEVTASYGTGVLVPGSRSYTNVTVDQTEQQYVWVPPNPVMSGRVVNQYTGAGVDGVTIQWSNGGGSTTTAGGGYFTNTAPFGWTGSIVPLYGLGSFSPATRDYTNVTANVAGMEYIWTPPDRVVSGRITDQATGAGLDGVTVNLSNGGGSTITVGGGYYSKALYHGWSGTVTPATSRGSFTPGSRTYSNLSADQANQDYQWLAPRKITGRITHQDTGAGEDGITLTFSNGGGSTTTHDGYYTQEVVYGWSGRVTPSYGSDTFTPAYRDYSNVTVDQSDQNYLWAPPYLAGDRYVSLSGLNRYPYTNWVTAAKDLQTAINATRNGDNVWVADGTYGLTMVVTCATPMKIRSVNGPEWTRISRLEGTAGLFSLNGSGVVLEGFAVENGEVSGTPTAGSLAGGVTLDNGAVVQNCIIRRGTNLVDGGAGGVALNHGAKAINCLIYNNAGGAGADSAGGVKLEGGAALVNCTVYGNSKSGGTGAAGVYQALTGSGYLDNTIVWSNRYENGALSNVWAKGTLYVRYSCYQDAEGIQTPENGTTSDPGFVDAAGSDFHLQAGSPCVDQGNDSFNALTTDLEGSDRKSQTIDMGVYEYAHAIAPTVRGRIVHQYTGVGVDGVTLSFSDGGGTQTTSGGGFYSNTVPYNWSGRATPSYSLGTFSPAFRDYSELVVDRSSQNYTWYPPLRKVSGRVTHQDTGAGVSGVQIQFSDGGGTATTDSGGYYTNVVYHGWSGVAVLSYGSGSFSPAQRSYQPVTSDLTGHNYIWIAPLRSIAGRITDQETGVGVDGVTLTFSNGGGSTTTSGGGYYDQSVHDGWSGSVTLSFGSGSFTPATRTYSGVTGDQDGQNYQWIRPRLIQGRVTNRVSGAAMDGVSVALNDNGVKSTLTSGGGYYSLSATYGWSGAVTPSYGSGSFLPASRTYSVLATDQNNQDFGWVLPVSIAGRVTRQDTGEGLDGVSVTLNDNGVRTFITSGGGYYTASVTYGWSGNVTLSYGGGSFAPGTRTYVSLTSDQAAQDYVWTPPVLVSGRITNEITGVGINGVTVNFSDGGGATTTSGGGYFTQAVVHGWSGNITLSYGSGSFVPASRTLSNVVEPQGNQDFAWIAPRALSGRITNQDTGLGVDGITISFTDAGSAISSGGGYYSKDVVYGWSGLATPSYGSGSFTPVYRNYAGVTTNCSGQDFTWRAPTVAQTRYVAPSGQNIAPYTNWTMAAIDLQTAINAASAGDSIWVTNGTYALASQVSVAKGIRISSVNGSAVTALRRSGPGAYGVLRVDHANAVVDGFTIEEGNATDGGGSGADLISGYVINCVIWSNAGYGVVMGDAPVARMANCLIVRNDAAIAGNGVIINCTSWANTAPGISGNLVYNSIVDGSIACPEIRFTLAPVAYSGGGNKAGNPSFVNEAGGDYHLQSASSARDAGNNYYNTLNVDLDGQPRVYATIDMGPYERPPVQGLAVTMADMPDPIPLGEELRYVVTARNAGPGSAYGVTVTNVLPPEVAYLAFQGPGSYNPGNGTWSIGDLAAGVGAAMTVRVQTVVAGVVTGSTHIAALTADAAEPGYDVASAVTTILDPVTITNLAASTASNSSTVEWAAVVGMGYDVYSSDEAYSPSMHWNKRAGFLASEEARAYIDADLSAGVMRRFYRITFAEQQPSATNAWGIVRVSIPAARYTMVSLPLRIDPRLNGELGRVLAESLAGDDGPLGDNVGDEVYLLESSGAWTMLGLNRAGQWLDNQSQPSGNRLAPGQGFWVARNAVTPTYITFKGPVGNDGTRTNRLYAGWNIIGLSEGATLPVLETLAPANPRGASSEENADMVVFQNPDGSWRRLMYVQGWGAPYDGNWFDLSTFRITTNKLNPGQAVYYFRQPSAGETDVRF